MEEKTIEKIIQNYKDKDFIILKEYIEKSNKKFLFSESLMLINYFLLLYRKDNNFTDYENWVNLLKGHILTKKIFKYLKFDIILSLEKNSQIKPFLEQKFNLNKKDYIIYKFIEEYKELPFFNEKNFFNYLNKTNELIKKYKIDLKNFDELSKKNEGMSFLFLLAIENGYIPKNEDVIKNIKEYLLYIKYPNDSNFALKFLLEQFVKTNFYINTIQPSKNLEKKLDETFELQRLVSKPIREIIINHPIFKLEKLKVGMEDKQKIELFNTKFLTQKNKEEFQKIQEKKDLKPQKKKLKI